MGCVSSKSAATKDAAAKAAKAAPAPTASSVSVDIKPQNDGAVKVVLTEVTDSAAGKASAQAAAAKSTVAAAGAAASSEVAAAKAAVDAATPAVPELFYFPIRGRAETLRFMMSINGIAFKETAVEYESLKESLDTNPFGQGPRLVIDGLDLVQSNAGLRYLGRKTNMYGANDEEAAKIDMYVDAADDARSRTVGPFYFQKCEVEAVKAFIAKHVDPASINGHADGFHVGHWNKIFAKNNSDFLVGGKLSIADVSIFAVMELLLEQEGLAEVAAVIKANYPAVVAYVDKIRAVPTVAAYRALETRPKM